MFHVMSGKQADADIQGEGRLRESKLLLNCLKRSVMETYNIDIEVSDFFILEKDG